MDPISAFYTINDLDIEETLIIIISKTMTTLETIQNFKFVKEFLTSKLPKNSDICILTLFFSTSICGYYY